MYEKCAKCGGWLNTDRKHFTVYLDDDVLFLHQGFCAEYWVKTHNVDPYRVKMHSERKE